MAQGSISKYTGSSSRSSSSSNPIGELFLTKMLSNPNYETKIILPGNKGVVKGFCEGPFSFSASADWKPIADVSQIEDQFAAGYAILSAFGAQANGNQNTVPQLSFKQVRGTELRYGGSNLPVFQIKLILPSYDPNANQSPTEATKLLMSCVLPTYEGTAVGDQLAAPLGYSVTFNTNQRQDSAVGTCTVKRGKFFEASGVLIKQVSVSFSQECMTDGKPLYVEANLEFQPWRMMEYTELMNWIKV